MTPSLCGVQAKTPDWIDSILVVMRSGRFIGESGRESNGRVHIREDRCQSVIKLLSVQEVSRQVQECFENSLNQVLCHCLRSRSE